jgi:ribonuclease Z
VPSLAYALVEDERPGRFNVAKALALGLKPGPLFSRLRSGMSVTLEDGRVVRPEEVLGPPRPGRKIVYSGDTRPTDLMIEFARGADVLIHDCTLGDELMEKAQENYHSTPRGAAEVARRAGVKQLVLMHISPRYEDDSILLEEAKKIFPNTLVAQDLMVLDIPLQEG